MRRLYKAFSYSLSGIKISWKDESAFRQEIILSILLLPAAFIFAPDKISLVLMISSLLLVCLVELINTAVEACIDRAGAEIHPLSKKAKDTASAAVLVSLINAAVVWVVILF